jgi:hypothetical protein
LKLPPQVIGVSRSGPVRGEKRAQRNVLLVEDLAADHPVGPVLPAGEGDGDGGVGADGAQGEERAEAVAGRVDVPGEHDRTLLRRWAPDPTGTSRRR